MTATADQPLKTTPLDALHRRLGARMVPFAGYDMPLHYSQGIIAEHLHARSHAVLFDVSHMGQATLRGDEAAEALESLVVADLKGMLVGTVRYTLLTNDQGGIIDDLMVVHGGYYLTIVVNASRKDIDLAHIADHAGQSCEFEIGDDRALLALQGPEAASVLTELAPASRHMLFMTAENLKIGDIACAVTRSGYTGEDGFEISISADDAPALADLLLEDSRVAMAGLGARDSLRLEAGLCLYGQDIDETTTPVEAGLAWTIGKRRRETGGFPGAEIILRQIAEGPSRRRVGIKLDGKVPARAGAEITDKRWTIGTVTSGGYGPSVGGPVAMGYVDADYSAAGTEVDVIVRGKPQPGRVVKLPFVPHRYVKLTP
ncbi:MAG TPA: glycine cleavage system aminomethyltransferase GcvT [Rhodospirillales bacterium]|nr:glycine cleavage system aminomethyltransferase GcvT [Rhodospirillales bacterium]